MNDNLITSCCDAAPIVESIDYDSIDDIDPWVRSNVAFGTCSLCKETGRLQVE